MKRRILLGLLALLLAVGCFGTVRAALADDTIYTEGTLYYKIINESITITGCFGKDEEVEVPNMIAGIPVNTIGTGAFMENEYIKTLKLPDTISKIEHDAIREDIYVIYNANTDHPQDYPTELILSNMDPKPTEQPTAAPTPEPAPTAATGTGTEDDEPSQSAEATQKPTATTATATPAVTPDQGDEVQPSNLIETDVDDEEDDTPAPNTQAPAEETQQPVAEATEAPAAEATAMPVSEKDVTAAPETTNAPETPVKPAEQPKNLTWLWITLGAAVAAGGTAAGAVAVKRSKKK